MPVPKPVEATAPVVEPKKQETKKPTDARDKSKAEPADKVQTEQTKPVAPPEVTPQPQAKLQLEVKAANLSFYKLPEHPSNRMLIDEAKAKGPLPVSSNSSTALPYWEIISKGDLINPTFTFQFHGIAVKGRNMQYGDSISQKSWSVDNPGGWSTTVRLVEKGTVSGSRKLYLVNVQKWFCFTGAANPTVTLTVQADNAETTIKEYTITISDF